MFLLHTKETVVAAAAVLLSGWLCGVITGAPTTRCFLYFIFPYVGTPGGETRPHPCRLSLLWGDKKGSWEKGWTWTREQAHHDGTLWGIFSFLHSDILTQQHWQFQKSLSSYCDDVSTESCFVKIKLYFVFVFLIIFFLLEGLWSCASFSLLSSTSEQASENMKEGRLRLHFPLTRKSSAFLSWSVTLGEFPGCFHTVGKAWLSRLHASLKRTRLTSDTIVFLSTVGWMTTNKNKTMTIFG